MRVLLLSALLALSILFACRQPPKSSPKILFEDNFDSMRTDWMAYGSEDWVVDGGFLKYEYSGTGANQRLWVRGDDKVQNYDVELRAYFPAGTSRGMYAVLGRMAEPMGGYAFQYDFGIGGLRFSRWCSPADVIPVMKHPLDAEWHNIKISFHGDTLDYSIDDHLIATAIDNVCRGGGFGLNSYRQPIWFDWFRVTAR